MEKNLFKPLIISLIVATPIFLIINLLFAHDVSANSFNFDDEFIIGSLIIIYGSAILLFYLIYYKTLITIIICLQEFRTKNINKIFMGELLLIGITYIPLLLILFAKINIYNAGFRITALRITVFDAQILLGFVLPLITSHDYLTKSYSSIQHPLRNSIILNVILFVILNGYTFFTPFVRPVFLLILPLLILLNIGLLFFHYHITQSSLKKNVT